MKIRYTLTGTDGRGVGYEVSGEVEGRSLIDPESMQRAANSSFQQLTDGKATYGKPGEGGCQGPYDVMRFTLEKV